MNRREIIAGVGAAAILGVAGVNSAQAASGVGAVAQRLRDEPIQHIALQKHIILQDDEIVEKFSMNIHYASGAIDRVESNYLIMLATVRVAQQRQRAGDPDAEVFLSDVRTLVDRRRS